MVQSSLLNAVTVPTDPSMLNAWAERIRCRICNITRSIVKLEDERQNLLSMLWEAGFHEYEIHTPESGMELPDPIQSSQDPLAVNSSIPDCGLINTAVLNESARSIIDLVSEESDEPTDDCCIPPTAQLPDSAPLVPEERPCPPTPILEEEDCSDPLFVTDENAVPEGNGPERDRVYRPWESASGIAWEKMELSELKQWMAFFGMKPNGGKSFMINQLKAMFGYINGTAVDVMEDEQRPLTSEETFSIYTQLIRGNKQLFERIILFENVEVSEVMEVLSSAKPDNVSLSVKLVKDYLTFVGAQFSNTSDNQKFMRRKRKKRRESVDDMDLPKTKRQLRRSITCP